jgi:hypothetical protein
MKNSSLDMVTVALLRGRRNAISPLVFVCFAGNHPNRYD